MLGEAIGQESGQTTGIRVLPSEGTAPKVEVSFQATGTLLGMEATDMGTYQSVVRPDGTLHGVGQGVAMTKDGGMATWRGEGVGRFTGRGTAASWRGAIYYQTATPSLARLNSVAVIFEFEVDENGKLQSKAWEWK
jgi:hypothetical protein